MKHINNLELSPHLIHIIECLFRLENKQNSFMTAEVKELLGCSSSYVTLLRKKWKNNPNAFQSDSKKMSIKEEIALAKKNKLTQFKSSKVCKNCNGNLRYSSNGSCVRCCTLHPTEKKELRNKTLSDKGKTVNDNLFPHKEGHPLPIMDKSERVSYGNTYGNELAIEFIRAKAMHIAFKKIMNNDEIRNKEEKVSKLLDISLKNAKNQINSFYKKKGSYLIPKLRQLLKVEQENACRDNLTTYVSHIPCSNCEGNMKYAVNRRCSHCIKMANKVAL